MSGKSKIEWTDATWNPVRGCSPVSAGCRNCYAARQAVRMSGPGGAYEGLVYISGSSVPPGPMWTGEIAVGALREKGPLHWHKPRRIFVNSMSDLFHEGVSREYIALVFQVMREAWWHTFQVLTKRPERMLSVVRWIDDQEEIPGNIWLGVSIEDQKTADERIPLLLQTPAAVRWVSYEPALGPVTLAPFVDPLNPTDTYPDLHWVVAGGESGPNARPCHPDWIRSVRDQCQAAGVPFLFKQWGEWLPAEVAVENGFIFGYPHEYVARHPGCVGIPQLMYRVGKRAAGRALDGRIWDEYPE